MSQSNRVIVVMAFDRPNNGKLELAFDAVEFDEEERAMNAPRNLAEQHAGTLVLSWEADQNIARMGRRQYCFSQAKCPMRNDTTVFLRRNMRGVSGHCYAV